MYHSITFRPPDNPYVDYNTWDTFHLIPTKRPHMGPPEMEFPYSNELLYEPIRLEDKLNSPVYYKSRSASWEFAVENGHNWAEVYSGLLEKLHGKIFNITLEDDPDYYYIGRISIKDWDSQPNYSVVTIEALCEPYKYSEDTILTFEHMARNTKTFTVTDTLYETPAILRVEILEAVDKITIGGLFTNRLTNTRSSQNVIINDVPANCIYTLDGMNKKITRTDISTGTTVNAMYAVEKLPSFPSVINGLNRFIVVGTPLFSSQNNVNSTIQYTPRLL